MPARTQKDLRLKIKQLPVLADDTTLRSEISERYGKEYDRRWFTNVCCEEAVLEALSVDSRANVRLSGKTLFMRYRNDTIDDGIAIWRVDEDEFGLYRWINVLD